MHRFLPVLLLLFYLSAYCQIDPKKVDSLARLIDSSANANQRQQESTIKRIDSNYHSGLNQAFQNSHNPDNLLIEQKRIEAKKRQQIIIRIVTGVLLLIIVTIALMRRKRLKP